MTKKHFQKVILCSAELSSLDKFDNAQRTTNLVHCLEDCNMRFNTCEGYYKGTSEKSFLVLPKNLDEYETVKDLCFNQFNQESILYQDETGHCFLEYQSGEVVRVGKFRQVNPKYIEQLDNYTIVNNRVYTTEKV